MMPGPSRLVAPLLVPVLTEQQPLRLAPHDNLTGGPVPNERRSINQIAFRDLLQDASLEFVSAAAADHNIRSALWFFSHNIYGPLAGAGPDRASCGCKPPISGWNA